VKNFCKIGYRGIQIPYSETQQRGKLISAITTLTGIKHNAHNLQYRHISAERALNQTDGRYARTTGGDIDHGQHTEDPAVVFPRIEIGNDELNHRKHATVADAVDNGIGIKSGKIPSTGQPEDEQPDDQIQHGTEHDERFAEVVSEPAQSQFTDNGEGGKCTGYEHQGFNADAKFVADQDRLDA
jgi:hypothetical protein